MESLTGLIKGTIYRRKGFEGDAGEYIRNWLRNNSTIHFLGVWVFGRRYIKGILIWWNSTKLNLN